MEIPPTEPEEQAPPTPDRKRAPVIARDRKTAAPRLLVAGEDGIFKMPDLKNMTMKAIADSMPSELVRLEFEGSGVAFRQSPAPGQPIKEGQRIRVAFKRVKIK
jgi:hypothetical protein